MFLIYLHFSYEEIHISRNIQLGISQTYKGVLVKYCLFFPDFNYLEIFHKASLCNNLYFFHKQQIRHK
jgi:hypothetical protein